MLGLALDGLAPRTSRLALLFVLLTFVNPLARTRQPYLRIERPVQRRDHLVHVLFLNDVRRQEPQHCVMGAIDDDSFFQQLLEDCLRQIGRVDLAKAVLKKLLEEGIIINRTHDTVLRFLPPYIIQKKHVDQVIAALDRALDAKIGLASTGQRVDKSEKNKQKSESTRPRRETVQREAKHAH